MSIYQINAKLGKRQGRYNYVTPRHYLDFIWQYVRLFNEKRDQLEDQQRHLNVGLDKLRATVTQVEELRTSLAVKRSQLEAKNSEANEKLQKMVADQQEAEQQKTASLDLQKALQRQNAGVEERRAVVMADLAEAEPAVLDAQAAVSNIKRQHLTEVRSMANPPEAVKLAMESVCTLLGHKIDTWKTVQGIIRREDFIASIVNFDTTKQMTRTLRERMQRDFIARPGYDFDSVNRASKACGPLVKWVMAQVSFSVILDRVGPLRAEVRSLEDQAETTKEQAATIVAMISELEASIARYKEEYAVLITEVQMIKSEMERVQTRVNRSITLLDSLSSERERWELGSHAFDSQMSTIAGDVILSAAFLAYAGYFDQQYREDMWRIWTGHLTDAGILFKTDLSLVEYLSSADQRLTWQSHGLPADELCNENAIMLQKHHRYPLVVDPSGQAVKFLLNDYKERKMIVTSFLDESFLKNLESALRFGTPLLVQDVEHLDPILNPVLNKEIRRAGGRVLIRLGNQDIDFSPHFKLFLFTRDPSVDFSPDICSRVTFVNFTTTARSLESQTLNQVLKVERPETDRKRTDLMKLQGEFTLRLRHLERALLSALNESSGNILDDDKVIDTLETLKREAGEVSRKMEETDIVIREVEQVTLEYLPLARTASALFFVLDRLVILNHFYQFSLAFFMEVFDYVLLHNPNLKNITDPQQRLNILVQDLFIHLFKRTCRALLHKDYLILAMLLAQVKLREDPSLVSEDAEMDLLIEGLEGDMSLKQRVFDDGIPYLTEQQHRRISSLRRLSWYEEFLQHLRVNQRDWQGALTKENPENFLPTLFPNATSKSFMLFKCAPLSFRVPEISVALRHLLLIRSLRPDRMLEAAASFVSEIFGSDLLAHTSHDLGHMVSEEVTASSPIILSSVPGHDASYRVESLVKMTNIRCTTVPLGSQEGVSLADSAIASAARTGDWVCLQNVHLAVTYLSALEKRLSSLSPHPNFRLFLTSMCFLLISSSTYRTSHSGDIARYSRSHLTGRKSPDERTCSWPTRTID